MIDGMSRSHADLVHFVGSIALDDAEEVFTELSRTLGPYAARLPDGETAERARWIFFQREMLAEHAAMELDPTVPELEVREWDGKLLRSMPLLRFKPGTDLAAVSFETGYDKAAEYSYGIFARLQADGVIGEQARFQVSLPTPMATGYFYVSHKARDDYLEVYERSLLRALNAILDTVPTDKLAIQFDVCQEVLVFENYFPDRPDDYKQQIFSMLARLGEAVPSGVDLGYHLCYGTPAQEHLVMPKDAGILVELLNGIVSHARRKVDYVHLPVPQHFTDDAYFLPFRDYKGSPQTKIYVGLIHPDDDEGNRQRIATAAEFIDNFGIATECGWGRADRESVPALLDSHRVAAESLAHAPPA